MSDRINRNENEAMNLENQTVPAAGEHGPRVPHVFWVGLVAVAVYVLIAAGLANLLDALALPASPVAEFALSHFVPLPILIAAGLVFAKWSGWSAEIWREAPAAAPLSRRWWMLAVPVLLLVNPVMGLFNVPWTALGFGVILMLAVGCLMIGVGEELFYRGILRVSLRAHHGDVLTLVVTSLLFGISHSLGSMFNAVPMPIIALQVGATMLDGALFYIAFRATGRLWVPIAIHAMTDFALYAQSNFSGAATGHGIPDAGTAVVAAQFALGALLIAFTVWAIRNDSRERAQRRAQNAPVVRS